MTAQPSPEFRQHHDVEAPQVDASAFRQGFRVRTRLDRLLLDGRITSGQWQVADEYRCAWAIALRLGGLSGAQLGRVSGHSDPHESALANLATIERLRLAEIAIGNRNARLCFACFVEDRSWAEIGREFHRNPETVREWTVSALYALSRAWGRAGGRL